MDHANRLTGNNTLGDAARLFDCQERSAWTRIYRCPLGYRAGVLFNAHLQARFRQAHVPTRLRRNRHRRSPGQKSKTTDNHLWFWCCQCARRNKYYPPCRIDRGCALHHTWRSRHLRRGPPLVSGSDRPVFHQRREKIFRRVGPGDLFRVAAGGLFDRWMDTLAFQCQIYPD